MYWWSRNNIIDYISDENVHFTINICVRRTFARCFSRSSYCYLEIPYVYALAIEREWLVLGKHPNRYLTEYNYLNVRCYLGLFPQVYSNITLPPAKCAWHMACRGIIHTVINQSYAVRDPLRLLLASGCHWLHDPYCWHVIHHSPIIHHSKFG